MVDVAVARFTAHQALKAELRDARSALSDRKLIERAKGALMTEHAMTEPESFRWIQRAAMDNRTTMRAVAELVLQGDVATEPAALPLTSPETSPPP